jgi:hypothetical protein
MRWNHDVLGGGTEGSSAIGLIDPDAFADSGFGHSEADAVDYAGSILARNDARKFHMGVAEIGASRFGVGRIHAGDVDADSDLSDFGRGVGHLAYDQDFARGAPFLKPYSFHD